jgi:hypothetical protein
MANGMTIEKLLLSKNRSSFDRIIKMFQSLVIKNQGEAYKYDTVEASDGYSLYEGAYEETDIIKSYDVTENELMHAGFTPLEAMKFANDKSLLHHLIMEKKDKRALDFISSKRKNRIESYIELNPYYRQFFGMPPCEEENIEVVNEDKKDNFDRDKIFIHEVKYDKYPITFNKYFIERNIDSIYSQYPYIYLKFLEKPLNPYIIHNKEQFEICYYKEGILSANELNVFFECYYMARDEILSFDYIEAFERTYNAYVDIMFLLILYYTFSLYCCKSLQRYAMRDYTDDEIYDILDSNNLSSLKKLNMGLLRNVIASLPDLQSNVGTRNVIDVIFDVVADNSVSVKELYLEKRYKTDDHGNILLDPNTTYDKNVDLVFKESVVKKGTDAAFSIDQEVPYENVVASDDSWGGTQKIKGQDLKNEVKRQIKLEILEKDFSSVLTKYLSINKIVDMYSKVTNLSNKLGIFYQINEARGNFLRRETVSFNGIEVTAVSIYASWCLLYATLMGLSDPDFIVTEASAIQDILYLRKSDELIEDAINLSHIEISIGNGISKTIGDYLTPEEINKYLVHFNYISTTSVSDIIKQYDENYEIIKAIDEKLLRISNYDEYIVWQTIKKANLISKNIDILFDGFTSYSEYIKTYDPKYWKYLEPIITNMDIGYKVVIKDTYYKVQEAYKNYIFDKTNGQIILATDEKNIAGGENIEDIALLFSEFMSYYTQIYRQNFNIGYDDQVDNTLASLYFKLFEHIITTSHEGLELIEKIISDKKYDSGLMANLELLHYTIEIGINQDLVNIELVYEKLKDMFKCEANTFNSLIYKKFADSTSSFSNHNIGLAEAVDF